MVARNKRAPPKKKFMTKLKQDPVKTVKETVKQTGPLQVPIAAFALGALGGGAMASQMNKIPMIGGILAVMASKGAKFTASLKR